MFELIKQVTILSEKGLHFRVASGFLDACEAQGVLLGISRTVKGRLYARENDIIDWILLNVSQGESVDLIIKGKSEEHCSKAFKVLERCLSI